MSPLNTKQFDLLRYICRHTHPIPEAELDGRVLRALLSRGFVDRKGPGAIAATDAGKQHLIGRRGEDGHRGRRKLSGRATAILHVVERLETAIPPEAEVRIGTIQAAASDILDGLRAYARRIKAR